MKIRLLFLVIFALLLLSACGGPKEASTEQMKADLFSSDAFRSLYSLNPMEINGIEVEKRQTDLEEKTDMVWVKADAQNDGVSGTLYYIITYGLYNDGWRLDKVEGNYDETWLFTPKAGPSEELIAQWIPDGAQIIDDTLWLEDGQQNIIYTYARSHPYCETVEKEEIIFTFDKVNTGLWSMFASVPIDEETTWNVCGQYDLYEDGVKTGKTATIIEFSPERIVWQVDSQPDYLRGGDVVDVSACSVNDYYMNCAGYGTDKERVLKYGYTFTIDNVDWSDIRYASIGRGANIFIGEDHIYAFDDNGYRRDAQREIPYTLRNELIPIRQRDASSV